MATGSSHGWDVPQPGTVLELGFRPLLPRQTWPKTLSAIASPRSALHEPTAVITMEAIYIPRLLKAPNHQWEVEFKEMWSGFETLTPVKGRLTVHHGGNFLEVAVQAETIVTLCCDRCLQNYNHRLQLDISELLWLDAQFTEADLPVEREVKLEDLEEKLNPHGYFEADAWIYEQMCLNLPLRKVCGEDCPGADVPPEAEPNSHTEPSLDSRWAALANLKNQIEDPSS